MTFRARLFGDLHVDRHQRPLRPMSPCSAGSLLALLLVTRGHGLARERVASELWPDRSTDQARKALRTTLWRLNAWLAGDNGGGGAVATDRESLRLSAPGEWFVDLWTFEDRLEPFLGRGREIEDEEQARAVHEATELHRRPLLEEFPDRWCEDRRHRMRLMWLTGLEALVRYRRRARQWHSVLLAADLVLRADPLRETMHRELMHAHYARGDRPSALRQFTTCNELLQDELGVGPMPLTRSLHARILDGTPSRQLEDLLDGR